MPVTTKDPVETVRIHFERNSWLTIPFSDMRGILGLTHEKANVALKTLEKEGIIKRVAHGKWRYEPRKNDSGYEAARMETSNKSSESSAPTTTFEIEQLVSAEEATAPKQPFISPSPATYSNGAITDVEAESLRTPLQMRAEAEAIFDEAFRALKDLYPMGATVEELFELVGKKGSLNTLRARFKLANEQGYARMERAPGVKNRGRGLTWKRFWVMDPLPAPTSSAAPGVSMNGVSATVTHVPPHSSHPPTLPQPLAISNTAPVSLQNAVSSFNLTYVEVLKQRREELSLLLRNVEHLQVELKLVEELIKMAEKQFKNEEV